MNRPVDVLRERRVAAQAEVEAILTKAEARGGNMLASEQREFEKSALKVKKIDRKLAPLEAEEKRLAAAYAASAELMQTADHQGAPVERSRIYVGAESSIYRPDARDLHGNEYGFFSDMLAASRGDWAAVERQRRFQQEQRINPNTSPSTGGEMVPPMWLTDKYQKYLRPSRPAADACQSFPLPPGTDLINIPRITLGSLTAPQTANAAPVASRDITTDAIAAPVITLSGQVDLSLQLLEQSPVAMDGVVFQDLAADIAKQVDQQVLYGSGSAGQLTGITNVASVATVTYTNGSPDGASTYQAIGQAVSAIMKLRFEKPDAIFMHPRRWLWLAGRVDSQGRPVVPFVDQFNSVAVGSSVDYDTPVATIYDIPVFTDAQISTTVSSTQDEIIVAKMSDSWLYESTLRLRAMPEVLSGTMQVRLQAYEYLALANRLAVSIIRIQGTGLAAPTGY